MFNIIAIFLQRKKKKKKDKEKKETKQRRKFTIENDKYYQTVDLTNNILRNAIIVLRNVYFFPYVGKFFVAWYKQKINEHFCLGVHDYQTNYQTRLLSI